jgi:outer membrane protein assembly factor BamE (lipoprotein component of BamABCDE complex)
MHFMIRSISSSVVLIAFATLLPLTGCDRSGAPVPALQATKMTRANYDQVHDKASKDEVRAILGAPTSEKTEDKLIYKRTTWRYMEGDKFINITFKNDELDSKDTNLGT